jgi:ATP/maltotriose-dependent transcriptional regulator MalT
METLSAPAIDASHAVDSSVANSSILRRPRLVDRLKHESLHRIALIVAPAGYGKSVLLREYLEQPADAQRVVYRVRSGNQTALGFIRGFVDALAGVGLAPPLHEYVYSNGTRNKARLREWFLEAFSSFSGTVVLDDLHLATVNKGQADFIARIIDESPIEVRWIIAARTVARLPVASWIGRGEVGVPITDADLSLSEAEAEAIAGAHGITEAHVADHVAKLAKGWPVAFSFASRLASSGYEPGGVARQTSTFVYQLLAEQVMSTLQSSQRVFLLGTCLLPSIDPDSLMQHWLPDSPEIIRSLQRDVAFIVSNEDGSFSYHDLFKDFLRTEVFKEPASGIVARIRRALGYLMKVEAYDAAVDLCIETNAYDIAVETLEQVGFLLVDSGYLDVVERAISAMEATRREPIIPALRACVEACQGNYVRADELFMYAIDLASGDQKVRFISRHAVSLFNRREYARVDALLGSLHETVTVSADVKAEALTLRAVRSAQLGDVGTAQSTLESALRLASSLKDPALSALTHHRAAFVFYYLWNLSRARAYALSAIRLADRLKIAELGARARTALAAIAIDQGDARTYREINEHLRSVAIASWDRNLAFMTLVNLFEIETEAGNVDVSRGIEAQLTAFDADLFRRANDNLIPARALHSAWRSDFVQAFSFVKGSAAQLPTPERRALRHGEIAMYAALVGEKKEWGESSVVALELLKTIEKGASRCVSRTVMARIILALANAIHGETVVSAGALDRLEFCSPRQRAMFSQLVVGVRAFARWRRARSPDSEEQLRKALESLKASNFGGYAFLIERAFDSFIEVGSDREIGSLTKTEQSVLEHVSRGLSTKEIAVVTERSPQTIDTHIKSILRKLKCRGRGEALYVARRRGLL